jgi:hypothetical protein
MIYQTTVHKIPDDLLHAGFLLGLHFYPEDGGDIYLWNIGLLSPNYTVL